MEILLLGSVIFAPLAFASVDPWAFGPLQAVFFGLAAYIFITGSARNPNPLYKNLLPAVMAVAVIGLLQSITENPVNAPSDILFTVWRPDTLNAVVTWLFYAAILYSVPQIITTRARLKRLLWTLFAMGVLIALMGMLQHNIVYSMKIAKIKPIYIWTRYDSFGPFINSNHGISFITMSVMAGLGLFFSGFRDLAARRGHKSFFDLIAVQFLQLLMIAVVAYAILTSSSQAGALSFALVAVLAGLFSINFIKIKKIKITAYVGLLVLFAGFSYFVLPLVTPNYGRLMGIVSPSQAKLDCYLKDDPEVCRLRYSEQNKQLPELADDSLNILGLKRRSMYKSGFELVKDFPVFGVGLGAVEHAFPYYRLSGFPAAMLVDHVHSDWLELFLQIGLAGGFVYLIGFLAALYFFFRIWNSARSFTIKALCGGVFCAIVTDSVHNLVEFSSQMPANALVFFILFGALASKPVVQCDSGRDPQDEEPPLKPARLFYSVPAAALAILLSVWTVPQIIAWRYDRLAESADFERKIKFDAASLKWSPDPKTAFRLGADYYNQRQKDPAPCALFINSGLAIAPYLRRAPVNYGLNRLDEYLQLQLKNCYIPRNKKQ